MRPHVKQDAYRGPRAAPQAPPGSTPLPLAPLGGAGLHGWPRTRPLTGGPVHGDPCLSKAPPRVAAAAVEDQQQVRPSLAGPLVLCQSALQVDALLDGPPIQYIN